MTATATIEVRSDILTSLGMKTPATFNVSFFRKNLILRVIPKDYQKDKETTLYCWELRLIEYVQKRQNDTGIIYCLSRDDAQSMAKLIDDLAGIPAAFYHAGMTPGQRMDVQNRWRSGEVRVVAATIAFGMGIDHPNVRYVIHATMSKSLEGYYQEAGRCGRDGESGECILFYGKRDGPRILNLIRRGKKKGSSRERQYALFDAVTQYCCNSSTCRHAQLLHYLGEQWDSSSCKTSCDVCRNEVLEIQDKEKPSKKTPKARQVKKPKTHYPGFTSAAALRQTKI